MIDDGRLERAIQEAKALGIKETDVSRETTDRPPRRSPEYMRWWHRQNVFSPAWLAFRARSDERARNRRNANG